MRRIGSTRFDARYLLMWIQCCDIRHDVFVRNRWIIGPQDDPKTTIIHKANNTMISEKVSFISVSAMLVFKYITPPKRNVGADAPTQNASASTPTHQHRTHLTHLSLYTIV